MRVPSAEPLVVVPAPGRFRRWLRSDMLVLRWIFLALYVVLVTALVLQLYHEWHEPVFLVTVAVLLLCQAFLIFGTGTIRLCHPIRKRRLILPVFAAATMMTLLCIGLFIALDELLFVDNHTWPWFLAALLPLSWIGWGVLMWYHVRGRTRHSMLKRLSGWIFAGSLA